MNLEGMPPDYAGKAYESIDRLCKQKEAYRAALVRIVNALNADPYPIHYKIREAINAARPLLNGE